MKFITIQIRNKTHKVNEKDIAKIHLRNQERRPTLPKFI